VVAASRSEVIITLTGASAGLGGLVLVFLGVLVAAYQPLVGTAANATLRRFRDAALAALVVFGASLVSLALDVAWLMAGGGHSFYLVAAVVFFVQLALLAGLAWFSTVSVLLKG
jgi:hypothetical protein